MAEPQHQIRALYTASTVTVYQAYGPEIGLPAARGGHFPAAWQRDRMTWIIKPHSLPQRRQACYTCCVVEVIM
ncbi:DUF4291 family protein [Streptomyces sp. NPDC048484]|uniref:DUF4291 family protein n=1 Tax=Streptomyces sp. NPDC048484 TaxID=3155146 RepID=UPI00342F00C6